MLLGEKFDKIRNDIDSQPRKNFITMELNLSYNLLFSSCLYKNSFHEGIRRNRLHIFVNNNLNTRFNSRCKKRYNATISSTDITIIKSTRNTHIIHNNKEEKINGEFVYMRTTSKFTHNDIIV